MQTSNWLKGKIMDYRRFVVTLLIISCYLYAGTLISIFEYGTKAYLYLYPILGVFLITAFIMTLKLRKWNQQIIEE